MPELTIIHFGLLVLMLVIGVIGGWFLRADRCAREKIAVSASWQDQLESQQSEHGRLAKQSKSLMEQISQYQASQKDLTNRAKELSDSLKEAFARRDELQRQLKDIRGNLEVAIAQRDRLKNNAQSQNVAGQPSALKDKDDKIFRLSRELTSWQSRVPPLVERFQERDKQARKFEEELEQANARLASLEDVIRSDNTRIEPVDADSLPDGGDASNEPNALTSSHDVAEIQDQIDENVSADEADSDPAENSSIEESAFAAVFSKEDDTANEGTGLSQSEYNESSDALSEDDADDASEEPVEHDADEDDDLKAIKGIGPSIEKTLNGLGITQFHQLAEISEGDIDRVAQQLKGFRSRIYREDWIGQARDLHAQKTGSLS
jgi:predicted flap endonuclease-1-like 5' DNA nuclease